jgi:hypothetical protein
VEIRFSCLSAGNVERRKGFPLDIDHDAISVTGNFYLPAQLEAQLEAQQQGKHD